jgi:hypothetical protein
VVDVLTVTFPILLALLSVTDGDIWHPMKAVQIPKAMITGFIVHPHATRHPENTQSDHHKLACGQAFSGLIYAQSGLAHYDRSG